MAPGYTFSDWINACAAFLEYDSTITNAASATPSTEAAFNTIYPRIIDFAEQRIYREVDLLLTRVKDTGALTVNNRTFTLPTTGGFIYEVLEQVKLTVSGVQQMPLLPVAKEALEAMYPADVVTTTSVPQFWAPVDQATILVGPSPSAAYTAECFGTKRPAPLSASNTTTFLTQHLPDLFLAASMVYWFAYQRDFGGSSADPETAQSWEAQYKSLFTSAAVEEARKKWQSQGWHSRQPSPIASPPQT